MLTDNKVLDIFRYIDILMYIFEHDIHIPEESIFGLTMKNESSIHVPGTPNSKIHQTTYDKWFMVAVHYLDDRPRDSECVGLTALNMHHEFICTYCSGESGIMDTNRYKVIEGVHYDDISSAVFQLQTIHNDKMVLALLLEMHLRTRISTEQYIPINIDRLLKYDSEVLSEMVEYFEDYIDSYEECNS